MPLSLTQLLSHAKARPIILYSAALLAIALLGYLIFSKPSREKLIKDLNSQLREEKFEQLYEEADEVVHLNVTKETFVKRMKMVSSKLKTIDKNLAFQKDILLEESMGADESMLLRAFQILEKDGKSVSVSFTWNSKGEFLGLSVLPTQGTSEEYRVLGVSAKYYSVGNQVLEW